MILSILTFRFSRHPTLYLSLSHFFCLCLMCLVSETHATVIGRNTQHALRQVINNYRTLQVSVRVLTGELGNGPFNKEWWIFTQRLSWKTARIGSTLSEMSGTFLNADFLSGTSITPILSDADSDFTIDKYFENFDKNFK